MDYRSDSPQLLLDFLSYHETIKAHSQRTVDEYYLDMRNFFRYLKQVRDPALADKRLDEIDIRDIDLNFVAAITLTDIYGYLTYLSRESLQHQNSEISNKGLNSASRARKLATIRSFFNYICNLHFSHPRWTTDKQLQITFFRFLNFIQKHHLR